MATVGGAAKCLVVVEHGARCPAFVTEMQAECVVHEQLPDEAAVDFARRVERAVVRPQHRLALAVLACSDRGGADHPARRRSVMAIADALAGMGETELLLIADADVGDELRQELFGLAETLCERLVGTAVGVRLRFSELQSGIASSQPFASRGPASNGN